MDTWRRLCGEIEAETCPTLREIFGTGAKLDQVLDDGHHEYARSAGLLKSQSKKLRELKSFLTKCLRELARQKKDKLAAEERGDTLKAEELHVDNYFAWVMTAMKSEFPREASSGHAGQEQATSKTSSGSPSKPLPLDVKPIPLIVTPLKPAATAPAAVDRPAAATTPSTTPSYASTCSGRAGASPLHPITPIQQQHKLSYAASPFVPQAAAAVAGAGTSAGPTLLAPGALGGRYAGTPAAADAAGSSGGSSTSGAWGPSSSGGNSGGSSSSGGAWGPSSSGGNSSGSSTSSAWGPSSSDEVLAAAGGGAGSDSFLFAGLPPIATNSTPSLTPAPAVVIPITLTAEGLDGYDYDETSACCHEGVEAGNREGSDMLCYENALFACSHGDAGGCYDGATACDAGAGAAYDAAGGRISAAGRGSITPETPSSPFHWGLDLQPSGGFVSARGSSGGASATSGTSCAGAPAALLQQQRLLPAQGDGGAAAGFAAGWQGCSGLAQYGEFHPQTDLHHFALGLAASCSTGGGKAAAVSPALQLSLAFTKGRACGRLLLDGGGGNLLQFFSQFAGGVMACMDEQNTPALAHARACKHAREPSLQLPEEL